MIIYDDGQSKKALTVGEGFWKWKLQEFAINGNSSQFDEWITKTAQFLSLRENRKQFRVIPKKSQFTNTEGITFNTEVYNDIYERVYGNKILLEITSPDSSRRLFDFTDSEINDEFRIPSMEEGLYAFKATVQFGGKQFKEEGKFIVKDLNPELVELTANHDLLKQIAEKSKGKYVPLVDYPEAIREIADRDFKARINSTESLSSLLKNPWYFLTIFLLFSTEWFLRKFWGGY
jgi:hypothetical protein